MKESELLAEARDELYKGWVQNTMASGNNVCAMGALRRATMGNIQNGAAAVFNKARTALDLKATEMGEDIAKGFRPASVMAFNDHLDTRKQDVLNLLDKTIIGLEEQGR